MNRAGYLGTFLMVVCLVSAAVLVYTYQLANPRILAHREQVLQQSREQVLPYADEFADAPEWIDDLQADPEFARVRDVCIGLCRGQQVGYVFTVAPYGYADGIVIMVGIFAREIIAVEVIEQAETPGLGDKIADADFRQQFSNLPTDKPVALTQDGGQIDGLAGATESSRAVARGVDWARMLYERIRQERWSQ